MTTSTISKTVVYLVLRDLVQYNVLYMFECTGTVMAPRACWEWTQNRERAECRECGDDGMTHQDGHLSQDCEAFSQTVHPGWAQEWEINTDRRVVVEFFVYRTCTISFIKVTSLLLWFVFPVMHTKVVITSGGWSGSHGAISYMVIVFYSR